MTRRRPIPLLPVGSRREGFSLLWKVLTLFLGLA